MNDRQMTAGTVAQFTADGTGHRTIKICALGAVRMGIGMAHMRQIAKQMVYRDHATDSGVGGLIRDVS